MGQILITIKLKNDSLDEIQHYSYVLVALDGFIVSTPLSLARRLSVYFTCRIINALSMFSSIIYSLSMYFFYRPGFPSGPQLARFCPPRALVLLTQTALV